MTVAKKPIEAKVLASAGAAAVIGVVIAVLNAVQNDPSLLGSLPTWLQSVILVAIPTVLTFLAGYSTPHTPRPDLGQGPVPPVAGGPV